tara:strand:+ start:183311 stop:183646 length:336 start_codon:yes stop_codon:yes gene_type:complete
MSDQPKIDWSKAPVKAVGLSVSTNGECYWVLDNDFTFNANVTEDLKFIGYWARNIGSKLASEKTLREEYIGLAMQALVTLGGSDCQDKDYLAKNAIRMADVLLITIEKDQS